MKKIVGAIFLFSIVACAQGRDIRIGFVSLTTAKEPTSGKGPDEFAPNVLVRFTKQGTNAKVLALTDKTGTAFVPLEAGSYCAEAYGVDGRPAKLSNISKQPLHRCFTAVAGRAVEFSLTLAADSKYGGSIPSVVIE